MGNKTDTYGFYDFYHWQTSSYDIFKISDHLIKNPLCLFILISQLLTDSNETLHCKNSVRVR